MTSTPRWLCAGLALALLAGCAGGGGSRPDGAQVDADKGSGGRYAMDRDAYPDLPPDVSDVPDAVPRVEPLASSGNRPSYEVWGKTYKVMANPQGYAAQGHASWYGEKFHGYATASGEIYDMYKMTAAHRSLPLPTYARVTNVANDRSVIVKVNDRGPFHDDRLIDLSYAAAARLDILRHGTGEVRVEAIDPVAWQANQQKTRQAQDGARSRPAAGQVASASDGPTPAVEANIYASSGAEPVTRQPAGSPTQLAMGTASPAATDADSSAVSAADERLYLQVAALGSVSRAESLRARLQGELDRPVRVDSDSRMHRVQVGPVSDPVALEALRSELRRVGYAQTFTITASD